MTKPKDIHEYITGYPEEIQKLLKQLRATIKKAAPKAEEIISAKGSVQFPFDKPLPTGLITKIVKFRVNENLQHTKTKRKY